LALNIVLVCVSYIFYWNCMYFNDARDSLSMAQNFSADEFKANCIIFFFREVDLNYTCLITSELRAFRRSPAASWRRYLLLNEVEVWSKFVSRAPTEDRGRMKRRKRKRDIGWRGATGRWKRSVKGSLGVSRQIESKTRCFIKAAGSMVVHQPR